MSVTVYRTDIKNAGFTLCGCLRHQGLTIANKPVNIDYRPIGPLCYGFHDSSANDCILLWYLIFSSYSINSISSTLSGMYKPHIVLFHILANATILLNSTISAVIVASSKWLSSCLAAVIV